MQMNIVYRTSPEYAKYLSVAIFALLENNKEHRITIHILHFEDLPKPITEIMRVICQNYGVQLNFVAVSFEDLVDVAKGTDVKFHPISRSSIFIEQLLSNDIDRALLLGIDTLVLGDISAMFNQDLSSNYIGAVRSTDHDWSKNIYYNNEHTDEFNADMIMFNLALMRKDKKGTDYIYRLIKSGKASLRMHEQSALYDAYNGNIFYFNRSYNFMIGEIDDGIFVGYNKEKPIIIQFLAKSKPWLISYYSKRGRIYWNYYNELISKFSIEPDKLGYLPIKTKSDAINAGLKYHTRIYYSIFPHFTNLIKFYLPLFPKFLRAKLFSR